MNKFGKNSKKQLSTAHPDLQRLFEKVIEYWDCQVLEGSRTVARQRVLVAQGASKTMDSEHLKQPSRALDVAPYPIKWNDIPRFYAFAGFVIGTAVSMGLKVRWGGDWDNDRDFSDQVFNDLVHFEIQGD